MYVHLQVLPVHTCISFSVFIQHTAIWRACLVPSIQFLDFPLAQISLHPPVSATPFDNCCIKMWNEEKGTTSV